METYKWLSLIIYYLVVGIAVYYLGMSDGSFVAMASIALVIAPVLVVLYGRYTTSKKPKVAPTAIETSLPPPPPPPPESIARPQEARTEVIRLAGSTPFEEATTLVAMAREQERLLDRLFPISEDPAREFFRKLGVPMPNEYRNAIETFFSFRSFALTSKGSTVHTWYLKIDPTSEGNDALYVHVDDPVVPIGLAVCKLTKGSFMGYYTTGSRFKDTLRL